MRDLTRRDFIKFLGLGAVSLTAGARLPRAWYDRLLTDELASDVVQCFDENATSGQTINEAVVQVMTDESIKALTGLSDVGEAWKSVFPGITQSSTIGIKVCNGNSLIPTHPAVVRSMINGLARMNVGGSNFRRNNIIIWEDHDSQLTQAGFTIYDGSDPDTPRCFGTDHAGVGYDTTVTFNINGTSANPSKILSQMCDYLINAATLRTHNLSTVTVCMKNHYGSVNTRQHTGNCNPALPALSQQIRDVITPNNIQKLFVVDGLFGLYAGGPGGSPNFNPKLLLMSRDTVACDAQSQNIINAERQRQGLSVLDAAHIRTAALPPYSLGTTNIRLIEVYNPTSILESQPAVRPVEVLEVTPQPFRGQGSIAFSLERTAHVTLDLVNPAGRSEIRIYQGLVQAGKHRLGFAPNRRLPAGSYYLRLSRNGKTTTRPLTVL